MVMPNYGKDAAQRLQGPANMFARDGMLLNDFSFLRIKWPGFQEDVFRNTNFSNVMEPARNAEFLQVLFTESDAFAQLLGVDHEVVGVAIPHVLARVDAARHREHH